ncbi:hypothetical protein CEF21_06380 [Bacillus sp. FJAT-42376]|uniref:PH domain-containing protein n=1 Tax=Bacillus sp. FJAT-42376 TaxID=2014076 RepID=UPI000F4ED14A|nr:PH domain-containing protein [Bacillus sp. FJAT-42376]AZB41948.1 hypothetical protein CEF21_06380 [Bacillus sp. FJAT-42376]
MTDGQKRFHPAWLLAEFVSFFKNTWFIIVFLYVVKADQHTGWIMWGKYLFAAAAAGTLLYTVLKWLTHTYEMTDSSIVLREGVFVKSQRNVPFDRIQNTHTAANFLHRMLGMTSLTLETGTNEGESPATFSMITQQESAAILELVQNQKQHGDPERTAAPGKKIYFQSSRKDNIKAACTSLSFFALFPILLGLYTQIDDVFSLDESTRQAAGYFKNHLWLLVPLVIGALVLSILVGYVQTAMKYGKYEIAADADRIYISKGMLSSSAFSIQKNRVQAIMIQQSLLKRVFGMAEIKLISAGSTGSEELETNSLYPFMAKREAYELLKQLLPAYQIEEEMSRLPKKVLLLRLIRPYYGTAAVGILLAIFKNEWLWITGVVFLIAILSRILNYAFTSYLRKGTFIQIRKGGFVNETFLTRRERIQQIEVSHSWLQRKFNTGTLQFTNRSKPVQVSTLEDLPREEVSEFYGWYKEKYIVQDR